MKRNKLVQGLSITMALAVLSTTMSPYSQVRAADEKYTEIDTGNGYSLVTQKGGQTLGYSSTSGIGLVYQDGYAFKDLNQNGKLDPYEDWRLKASERAADLAGRMVEDRDGIEAIAGLMLYSGHQMIPGGLFGTGTYDGKPYNQSDANAWDLCDQQKTFLEEDDLRHVLMTSVESPAVAAKWNNEAQAFVEGLKFGIPVNSSSDPRHSAGTGQEYNVGANGTISEWPSSIGLTATFNPELVKKFGDVASKEYRALGIATALSPQVDLATEPRWSRVSGTFGENSKLATDLSRAYIDGFQTTYSSTGKGKGWGMDSVNAMVKHWPSGGPEEGGRDAHYGYGKYAVYPGNNFDEHLLPFTEGAFKLEDGTEYATAVMPYYTISYNQDKKYNENVGNGFSDYIIGDLLRGEYDYDGVVCTDWQITHDASSDSVFEGKCWGVEDITETERHYKVLMAGGDQFGGNNVSGPVMGAYDLMVQRNGKSFADNRFKDSARRLLMNIFNTGLFENPYLDPEESETIVGNAEFMEEGYDAQIKSVVMIKNKNNIISPAGAAKKKVYIPETVKTSYDFWTGETITTSEESVNVEVAKKFFDVVTDPAQADMAIIGMQAPSLSNGYDDAEKAAGGSGYVPISLQYSDYTATTARATALANDPGRRFINSDTGSTLYTDTVENRSYRGKTAAATDSNKEQMRLINETKSKMGAKPVVVYMRSSNAMIWSEVEPKADAIVVGYSISDQAALEVISGTIEPSGLLPLQQPENMETVEAQYEDVPQDMICHVDTQGNTYDFGFGLNWSGKINDARTMKYVDGNGASLEDQLGKAKEELEKAREELRKAQEELEIAKKLKTDLDKAKADLDKAKADLKAAQTKLSKAQKDADALAVMTGTTKIKSAKNSKSKKIAVKLKKNSKAAGYQIQYSLKKSFKNSTKKKTAKTSYTISKLKKKTYHIRARAYAKNSNNKVVYGKWSKVKSVKVKK